jgi:hypothetical protein
MRIRLHYPPTPSLPGAVEVEELTQEAEDLVREFRSSARPTQEVCA